MLSTTNTQQGRSQSAPAALSGESPCTLTTSKPNCMIPLFKNWSLTEKVLFVAASILTAILFLTWLSPLIGILATAATMAIYVGVREISCNNGPQSDAARKFIHTCSAVTKMFRNIAVSLCLCSSLSRM